MKEDKQNPWQMILLATVVFSLALSLRVALFKLNTGYYTDEIVHLILAESPTKLSDYYISSTNKGWLYPLAIRAVNLVLGDFASAGKLLSMLSGALGAVIFFLLVYKLFERIDVSFTSTLLFAVNPVLMYWDLRVMADSLFLLLLLAVLYLAFSNRISLAYVACCLCLLVKLEGLIIFILTVIYHITYYRRESYREFIFLFLSAAFTLLLLNLGINAYSSNLMKNVNYGLEGFSLERVGDNSKASVISLAYLFNPLFCLFLVYGLMIFARDNRIPANKRWLAVTYASAYGALAIVWPFFQLRHWMPFIPFLIMFGVVGLMRFSELTAQVVGGILKAGSQPIYVIFVSLITLFFFVGSIRSGVANVQALSQTFSDIKDAGEWISRSTEKNSIVFSNDVKKLSYFAKRDVYPLDSVFLDRFYNTSNAKYLVVSTFYGIDWIPENASFITSFESKTKAAYPANTALKYSSSYKWAYHINEEIYHNTSIYRLL